VKVAFPSAFVVADSVPLNVPDPEAMDAVTIFPDVVPIFATG
jgi:hypothetical protein